MANRERGEFRLIAGTSTYILQLTTNSCCELEDFTGRPFDEIQRGAKRGFVKDMRLILWAALWAHHPDIAAPTAASLQTVGSVMDEGGGVIGLHRQILAFIALNADPGEPAAAGGAAGTGPPRRAQAGTGVNSMWTH